MECSNPKSLADVRRWLKNSLSPKYGEREAAAMARMILLNLKDWSLPILLANEDRAASEFIINRSQEILNLLLADVPIQYALGEAQFYGLKLKVGPGVLVPRQETEELVDLIVREDSSPDLRVLDLCTGSGAIAVALARNLPFSQVTALDVSAKALDYCRANVADLKVKVNILHEDIFKAVFQPESYDIIVSNPPYVDESEKRGMDPNVLNHEPPEALFVPDDDPLVFYRRIAEIAKTALESGGKLYLEINPRHAARLQNLLESYGFTGVEIIRDVHNKDRFIKARKG